MTNTKRKLEDDIYDAAQEVADGCKHAFPSAADLVNQLTEIESKRTHVINMMAATDRYLSSFISSLQYKLLTEFVAVQAAKIGGNMEELIDEICIRYSVMDVQELKVRDFWEALNFIWHYAEEQS